MAKFVNKHDDRLYWRKLFRLLIDSARSVCNFEASALALPHSFHIFYGLFAVFHYDHILTKICRFNVLCSGIRRLWPVLSSIPFLFILDRADFWRKMIDTFVKSSSINSVYRKDAVENLLYTISLSLHPSQESSRQQTECENRSEYYSNSSIWKLSQLHCVQEKSVLCAAAAATTTIVCSFFFLHHPHPHSCSLMRDSTWTEHRTHNTRSTVHKQHSDT